MSIVYHYFIFCSGATIIQNLHYKQIYDRRECEKKILLKVKTKMEKIRAINAKYSRSKDH